MADTVKDFPPYLDYPKPKKKQTNADKIRAMTDEELAGVVTCPHIYCPYSDDKYESEILSCNVCIRNWLKQETEE